MDGPFVEMNYAEKRREHEYKTTPRRDSTLVSVLQVSINCNDLQANFQRTAKVNPAAHAERHAYMPYNPHVGVLTGLLYGDGSNALDAADGAFEVAERQ